MLKQGVVDSRSKMVGRRSIPFLEGLFSVVTLVSESAKFWCDSLLMVICCLI